MIAREDMLELTRRMTPARSCFSRLAGAYMDQEGFADGTFNINFLNLKPAEKEKNLLIAKAIPFSQTNYELKDYSFPKEARGRQSMWQLLEALKTCGLKNDALMDILYEKIGQVYQADYDYAIYLFYGVYDVPVKGADQAEMWESEETYEFMIGAICPLTGRYEPGRPEWGFLYPAFANRSTYANHINIYQKEGSSHHPELLRLFGADQGDGSAGSVCKY